MAIIFCAASIQQHNENKQFSLVVVKVTACTDFSKLQILSNEGEFGDVVVFAR